MDIEDFLTHFSLYSSQLTWFLGAGASRSAGMPSATDIIWDLKRRYYCTHENQDISDNELSNEAVRAKIQSYLEAHDLVSASYEEEYAYYFKLVFGDDPAKHQRYLEERLNPKLISITSGHRILTSLMAMNKTKLIFTTNFDSVVENAFAFMTERELHSFALDGSYAALKALNDEQFPIYAKMHGDFRYFEMKNLPEQLVSNDREIEKCFLNSCARYGMVVTGYSGRDKNVMTAFEKALEQENSFPHGLFWMGSITGEVLPSVKQLIEKAQAKGVKAHIVKTETFDSLMVRLWKVIENKPPELDAKVKRIVKRSTKIDRYDSGGQNYPLIRLNTFPIVSLPQFCLALETKEPLSNVELVERMKSIKTAAIITRERKVFAWGPETEIHKIIPKDELISQERYDLVDVHKEFSQSSLINSFYTKALVRALARGKPLKVRMSKGEYYLALSSRHEKFNTIEGLFKDALKTWDFNQKKEVPARELVGRVPGIQNTFWMEAARVSIDYYDGKFWLTITPDIWVEPREQRKEVREFITTKKRNRYNATQNRLLDVWKSVLMGSNQEVNLSAYENLEANNPSFLVDTTTAFSFRS